MKIGPNNVVLRFKDADGTFWKVMLAFMDREGNICMHLNCYDPDSRTMHFYSHEDELESATWNQDGVKPFMNAHPWFARHLYPQEKCVHILRHLTGAESL